MYFWHESQWDPVRPSNAGPDPDEAARRRIADHWAAADRDVAVRLALGLLHDDAVESGDVHVRVQSGVAILEGRVGSEAMRAAAVARAWATDGTRDVCDLLVTGRRRRWARGSRP